MSSAVKTKSPDRRAYWTQEMEAAHAFMQRLLAYPVAECGEPLDPVPPAAAAAGIQIAFPEGKKLGILIRDFRLRRSLIPKLLVVAESLLQRGYLLKLEDAYRSLAVQQLGAGCEFILRTVLNKVRWELHGRQPTVDLLQRRVAVLTATTPKFANHISGSAIDISVLQLSDHTDLDRGGKYLELSEKTPMLSPFITPEQRRNRQLITDLFMAEGFLPYPYEFWHYSHGDADYELLSGSGQPARFGPVDLDPLTGAVTPVPDPDLNLLPAATVRAFLRRKGLMQAG